MENNLQSNKFLLFVTFSFLSGWLLLNWDERYETPIPKKVENLALSTIDYKIQAKYTNLFSHQYENVVPVDIDLQDIKKRGKLIALTGYNNTSYFIYKGIPMGYEYELLAMLAKSIGVDLQIVVANSRDEMIQMLNRGEGDLIADNFIVTKAFYDRVSFTSSVYHTRQVLIQKKPSGWQYMTHDRVFKNLLRNPIQLMGKTVYVPQQSVYFHRLQNLSEEIGADIKLVEVSSKVEDLIEQVSEGKIPYTVADENIALVSRFIYPNIDVNTPIGFPQRVAWATRVNAPNLVKTVDDWLKTIRQDSTYSYIYYKYYKSKKTSQRYYIASRSSEVKPPELSTYDKRIRAYAKELNWDWRLLASLVYQESQFNPLATSDKGATGLMQLMPTTAKLFGANNLNNPDESLKAGIKYIKWLENFWRKRVPDKDERLKFVMASYNVGQEHVADAQRLALKYKRNPKKWDGNVAYFILHKSNPKFSTDPVVKYGPCRGKETFKYVNEVLARYQHYKNLIKEKESV